jgi:hypothetical protein
MRVYLKKDEEWNVFDCATEDIHSEFGARGITGGNDATVIGNGAYACDWAFIQGFKWVVLR